MKQFITSVYIIILDFLISFAGYDFIEWMVSTNGDYSVRCLYVVVVIFVFANSMILIENLIEKNNG